MKKKSQSHRPDLVNSHMLTDRFVNKVIRKVTSSQSHRPDLVNSHVTSYRSKRSWRCICGRNPTVLIWSIPTPGNPGYPEPWNPAEESQSHRPDLVNSHQEAPPRGSPRRLGRNPTVLIWSIPTARDGRRRDAGLD